MIQRYYQVIFCSERENRAFRREVSITDASAMVTDVEKLPPHYDGPLERYREADEAVLRIGANITYWSGYKGCPFCGNRTTFQCSCGYLSCVKSDHNGVHACPKCRVLHNVVDAKTMDMSKSGFIHGDGRKELPPVWDNPPPRPTPPPMPQAGPPDTKKIAARERWLAAIEERQKHQIEDKRDKDKK